MNVLGIAVASLPRVAKIEVLISIMNSDIMGNWGLVHACVCHVINNGEGERKRYGEIVVVARALLWRLGLLRLEWGG